jgi:hypothetical protein
MKPVGAMRLHVEPVTLSAANRFIAHIHRHHGPTTTMGGLFAVAAVSEDGGVVGVATAAFPIAANRLRNGWRTVEVTRVATDGTPNACSILYSAVAQAARRLGFAKAITYVLAEEQGVSVKAAGWQKDEGVYGDLSWENHRGTGSNTGPKGRWSIELVNGDRPELVWPEYPADERPDLFTAALSVSTSPNPKERG